MKSPRFEYDLSVIIPAYNVECYIEKAIESAFSQKDILIEVIVSDDGSTDKTVEKVKQMQNSYRSLRIYTHENVGLYKNRVVGVEKAKGKYIAFLDADDYIDRDFYSNCLEQLEKEKIDVLEFGYRRVNSKGIIQEQKLKNEICTGKDAIKELLEKNNAMCSAWNKIFKASLFENVSFDENVRNHEEDLLMNIKVLKGACTVKKIEEIGYNYSVREGSITTSKPTRNFLIILETWKYIYELFVNDLELESLKQLAAINYCAKLAFCYCLMYNLNENENEYANINELFIDIYKKNDLENYKYKHESRKRRILLNLFKFNPHICKRVFRVSMRNCK